jgi:hypothetical protein
VTPAQDDSAELGDAGRERHGGTINGRDGVGIARLVGHRLSALLLQVAGLSG